VDIRTIDSLIVEIAAAYHTALGLPADTGAWARNRSEGYAELAARVAHLLRASPMIARTIVCRYPIVICDEHQDTSADQHAIVMVCHDDGASLRIFGDPMQRIYGGNKKAAIAADNQRWEDLKRKADTFEELDEPHRWADGFESLGRWILDARLGLRAGGKIDLRGALPMGVSYITGENQLAHVHGRYGLAKDEREPIDALVKMADSLLVLTTQNDTAGALRSFFFRTLPIWEGHVRESLATLIGAAEKQKGNAAGIAEAAVTFVQAVATGFSSSGYGKTLLAAISDECCTRRRGKPATLQELGRVFLRQPDHKGVASFLRHLSVLMGKDSAFKQVKLDHHREFWDAVRIGEFDDPAEGFGEIARRRTYARPLPPAKAISTIHKAKGLECDDVLIMPCDRKHFGDTDAARRRLYVAMSRAKRSLTFVVSRKEPSPLFML
jgi:DNA helicase-2/ATP-dependent DNA helicase PcrA